MEKDAFLRLFGGSNLMKVFNYLIDLEMDVSVKDVMDGTDLSRKTVEKAINSLKENQLIEQSRLIGKTKMYQLNFNNPVVKKLKEINFHVIKEQKVIANLA